MRGIRFFLQRFSSGEVYPICKECRHSYASPEAKPAHDVVKRAIAEDIGRSKGSSTKHRHKRSVASASEDDSTADDATNLAFSRESSAD